MNKINIYNQPIQFKSVMAFTLPTILMTLIQASYMMIDGMFISHFIGEIALSSLTIISPYFSLFVAIGAMFAAGGSAVVMKKMGEQNHQQAREDFTTLTLVSSFVGLLFTLIFLMFTDGLTAIFSVEESVFTFCKTYLFAYSFFIIPQILFGVLQTFTIAAGHSKRAMITSVLGGVTNIVLDFLMIKVWNMGMWGAALASGLGMVVPCVVLIGFFCTKKDLLHFTKLRFDCKVLVATVINGSSELATNLVTGIVIMLFNARMLVIAGAEGVAASTITFYVFGFMSALYMGYMLGVAPLLSYFYGAQETEKLKKIKTISIKLIGVVSAITAILAIWGSEILVGAFTAKASGAYALAVTGNRLFSLSLFTVGYNAFASMLFTALSNGKISAVIAFSRSFVFLVAAILILPYFFGINGLWLSVPISELLACGLSVYCVRKYKNIYHY